LSNVLPNRIVSGTQLKTAQFNTVNFQGIIFDVGCDKIPQCADEPNIL